MQEMQRPVLSLIALVDSDHGRKVLLQERSKIDDDTPFGGFLEVPQGRVGKGETITTFAALKLREEAGLEIIRFLVGAELSVESWSASSRLFESTPFCCVVDSAQNHFAVAVVVLVTGETRPTQDARGHRWCSVSEVNELLVSRLIFPLNAPMLRRLLKHATQFELSSGGY